MKFKKERQNKQKTLKRQDSIKTEKKLDFTIKRFSFNIVVVIYQILVS